MAEELLGVGFDDPRRRQRPHLPAPRERGRADARGARRRARARSGCTTGCSRWAARRWPRASGNITLARRRAARALGPRRGGHVLRLGPLPPADRVRRRRRWPRRRPTCAACARPRGAWRPGPRRRTSRRSRSASSPRWPTTSTRRRALAAVCAWVREANRREPGTGRRRPARDARRCSASTTCSTPPAADGAPDAEALELLERREAARARARLRRGRPPARRARRAGWQVRDAADGPAARARVGERGPLRAQPDPRGAAGAAAAPCTGSGPRRGAAREPWLRDVACVEARDAEEIAAARGQRRPPGRLRRGRPLSVRRRRRAAGGARPAASSRSTSSRTRRTSARSAARPSASGADGVVIPERRSAEVTPAVCKASAGAVEHLRVARVRNLADFLADAKDAGCWCYGAAAEGARVGYLEPDYSGRRRARRSAPRDAGCDRAWPRRAMQLVRAAAARARRLAQRERRGGRPAVRDLAAPRRRLTALHKSGTVAPS